MGQGYRCLSLFSEYVVHIVTTRLDVGGQNGLLLWTVQYNKTRDLGRFLQTLRFGVWYHVSVVSPMVSSQRSKPIAHWGLHYRSFIPNLCTAFCTKFQYKRVLYLDFELDPWTIGILFVGCVQNMYNGITVLNMFV